MILKVIVDDQLYELNVPAALIDQAGDFFAQMDKDMDKGWQMSRDWVANPNLEQRAQIVGNKLLTALEKENHQLGRLMAGYLLSRLPNIDTMELDTSGEIQNTRIAFNDAATSQEAAPSATPATTGDTPPHGGMDKMQALEQAGKDVTKIFKVGRHWRFSLYDHASGQWQDSASIADKDQAERLRQEAFKQRYESLSKH
jgi:hypothetical protein